MTFYLNWIITYCLLTLGSAQCLPLWSSISTAQKRTTITCGVIHCQCRKVKSWKLGVIHCQCSESSLLCTTSYLASDHLGTLPHQRAQFSASVSESYFRYSSSAFQVSFDSAGNTVLGFCAAESFFDFQIDFASNKVLWNLVKDSKALHCWCTKCSEPSTVHSLALQRLITSHNSRAVVNLSSTYLGSRKILFSQFFPVKGVHPPPSPLKELSLPKTG